MSHFLSQADSHIKDVCRADICRRYMSQHLFPAHMGTSTHWSYDTGYHGGKRRHSQRRVWGLTTRSRAQEELELQKEGW